jgi:hypothetical protein
VGAGVGWSQGDPFDSAPLHLAGLLNPYLSAIGADVSHGFTCVTTLPPDAHFRHGPAIPVGYSYPGNGQTGWPVSEQAREGPFTPGDFLGLPQPRKTGPYLMAFFEGPWQVFGADVFVTSASVTSPRGKVQIKIADASVKIPGSRLTLGAYMGSTAMLIPVKPLATGTTYSVQVRGTVKACCGQRWQVSERFSFTTGGRS